jgi:hypothetical protein
LWTEHVLALQVLAACPAKAKSYLQRTSSLTSSWLTWEVAAKNQQVHIWLILLGHYDYHVTSFCWQRSSPRWVVEHHTCICDWGFMLPFQWCFVLMGLQFHPTHAKSFGHVQTY